MATKKRYRKNYRFYIMLFIVIIFGVFLTYQGFYYLTTSKVERDLKHLKYSNEVISKIIDNNLDKYLINNNIYSKTLEVSLAEGVYNNDLLEEYIYFPYKEYTGFISQLNNLNKIGYERKDVEVIFEKLDKEDIDIIIDKNEVVDNLFSYINNEYFRITNLDRYIKYKKKFNNYEYEKIVSHVNMYLDYPYYEHDIKISNLDDILVLANKYYKLDSDFVPKNLVKISSKYTDEWERWVVPVAKENFEKMAFDMEKMNLSIKATSAYRSYDTQDRVYKENVNSKGKDYADSVSARAGYSEHQTGLAIDVKNASNNYSAFKNSKEYKWMKDNAHKYGFILRYPEDKTNITGYNFEAWHYRYVGKDVAEYIYENDLTLDEYYAMFLENKKAD